MLLATASPRSSWQCALKIALSAFGTRCSMSGEELAGFVRRRVADRVRQVDGGRAFADDRLDHAAQEVAVAPGRILRRKLHIVGELPREANRRDGQLEARLARDAQLARQMQIGGREEGVDARARGRLERARRLFDVLRAARGPARRSSAAGSRRAIWRTASESAAEAIGKPASMMSTPSASRARASVSLAGTSSEKPGACSPSRSVVSKMTTRSGRAEPWLMVLL